MNLRNVLVKVGFNFSVERALKPFTKVTAALEEVEKYNTDVSVQKYKQAVQAQKDAEEAAAEVEKAKKMRQKLEEILNA